MDVLNDEMFKLETQRDELSVKVELLEKQADESQAKEAELQKLADQAIKLKDEVDILRETADKAAKYEATIESYKKKMEELSDLRRQVKLLEEKNTDYMHRNVELEEDVKKTGNWRPQVDQYKKQVAELHAKLDSETKKSDRLEFETKKMIEKVEALSVERDRLQAEREDLKAKNDELSDEIKFGQATGDAKNFDTHDPDSGKLYCTLPVYFCRCITCYACFRYTGNDSPICEGTAGQASTREQAAKECLIRRRWPERRPPANHDRRPKGEGDRAAVRQQEGQPEDHGTGEQVGRGRDRRDAASKSPGVKGRAGTEARRGQQEGRQP